MAGNEILIRPKRLKRIRIFFNVRNVNNISPNIYIVPGGGGELPVSKRRLRPYLNTV